MARRSLLAAVMMTLALSIAPNAKAQIRHEIGIHGDWGWVRGTTPSGRRLCTMGTARGGREFYVKHYQGDDFLTVQLMRDGWAIPEGTRMRVAVKFGQETPWGAEKAGGEGNMVQFTIGTESGEAGVRAMATFLTELRLATTAAVVFPDGTEPPWVLSLIGSNRSAVDFFRCIQVWTRPTSPSANGPTQPFGSSAPPQPTQPTQPHGVSQGTGPMRRS